MTFCVEKICTLKRLSGNFGLHFRLLDTCPSLHNCCTGLLHVLEGIQSHIQTPLSPSQHISSVDLSRRFDDSREDDVGARASRVSSLENRIVSDTLYDISLVVRL